MNKYITKNAFNIIRRGIVVRFAADTVYEFDDNEAQVLAEHLAEAPKKASAKSAKVVSEVDNRAALAQLDRLAKTAETVADAVKNLSTGRADSKKESLG